MINLATQDYTQNQILKMLKKNRRVEYVAYLYTNKGKLIKLIRSLSGQITFDSESAIMGSASLEVPKSEIHDYRDNVDMRIRPVMLLWDGSKWLEFSLGLYIISEIYGEDSSGSLYYSLSCYDYNLILQDDSFTESYTIASGTSYTAAITTILQAAGITNISIGYSDKLLSTDKTFDAGSSRLDAINALLTALNFMPIHFLSGIAYSDEFVQPVYRTTEYDYMTDSCSIIKSGGTLKKDMFGIPNVITRYCDNADSGDLYYTYTNSSAASPVSTVNRGRKIVNYESVEDIADAETLHNYVLRVAYEKNQIYEAMELETAVMPQHGYRDCIFVRNDEFGIADKYIEYSWSIDLGDSPTMTHTMKKVISLAV